MKTRTALSITIGAALAASLTTSVPAAAGEPGGVEKKVIVTNKSTSSRGGPMIPRVSIAPRPAPQDEGSRPRAAASSDKDA